MTFSYVAVRSYVKLGVPMPEAQKNAYVHCWNVVGYLMGIREDLLPANYAESRKLYEAIREHQGGRSAAGQALTAALMNLLKNMMPPGARHLPVILTRYLVGSQNAQILGLTKAPFRNRVQFWCMLRLWRSVVLLSTPVKGARPYRFASEWLHRRLMDRMGQLPGSATFRIPPEFLERWFPDRSPDKPLQPRSGHDDAPGARRRMATFRSAGSWWCALRRSCWPSRAAGRRHLPAGRRHRRVPRSPGWCATHREACCPAWW